MSTLRSGDVGVWGVCGGIGNMAKQDCPVGAEMDRPCFQLCILSDLSKSTADQGI